VPQAKACGYRRTLTTDHCIIPRAPAGYNRRAVKYHIWTEGCQMNVADSQRVASSLERLGYGPVARAEEADVIVLNTLAEDPSHSHDEALLRIYARLRPGNPVQLSQSPTQVEPAPDGRSAALDTAAVSWVPPMGSILADW